MCDSKGRDCIEMNSTKSFNCSTTCKGIYADVQWVGKKMEEDEESVRVNETEFLGKVDVNLDKVLKRLAVIENLIKNTIGEKGEEVDKEKYKMLFAEYRRFKAKHVKHFKFNSVTNSSLFDRPQFGKF